MTPLRNGLSRVFLFIIIPAVVILIVLNIYLNGKLKEIAPLYLDKYSKRSGLNLHLDGIGLDPLFRVKMSGVKAGDPSQPQKGLAEIGTVIIDPGILSSILHRRIIVSEIALRNTAIRYDKDSFKKVFETLVGGEGGHGGTGVTIKRIRLIDARVEVSPEVAFTSNGLVIQITKKGGDESDIAIDGDIAVFGNGIKVAGTVNIKPGDTSGKISLTADKFQPGSTSGSLVSERNLRGVAEVSFRAAGTINSDGNISVISLDNKDGSPGDEVGKLDYALEYDRNSDTASVSKLGFDLMNTVSGDLSGDVKDLTGGIVFDLHGSASSGDLKFLAEHVPAIDPETLAGTIHSDNMRVEGSVSHKDLRLTGNVILGGINIALDDGSLRITGLDCRMDVSQFLSGDSGFRFSSNGPCKAGEFFEKDIGEMKNISADAGIEIRSLWSNNDYSLSDFSGTYMDGIVAGTLKLTSENGINELTGTINGRGLNLGKAPKSILPFDMGGTAGNLTADIRGKHGEYKAGISLAVNDFILRSEQGREFRVLSAKTKAPLEFEYTEDAAGEDTGTSGEVSQRKIIIRDKGLTYQKLSFGEYMIESGKVDDILFALDPAGDWSLGLSSVGTGFQVHGMETGLNSFKEHIDIGESGRKGFSGTIEGTDGRFKSITFPALSAEYLFDGNSIHVHKLSAEFSPAGELKTDNLAIDFGSGKGGYPYKITLKDGTFSGYEGHLTADGIAGSFTVNNPESGQSYWGGNASAAKADIFSGRIEGLRLEITPSQNGIILKEITGKFIDGLLKGKIEIVTSGPATKLITDLELESASSKSGDLDISIGRADFNFSGALTESSLPQGTGKFSFSGLNVKKEGLDTLYSGGFSARTSGETLFLEDGLIRNKDKSELRFSGQMENTSGGDRDLRLAIPDFTMSGAIGFMSPLLPPSVRDGKVSGNAGLELDIKNLFSPERSWSGDISFYRVSFAANMGGGDLLLRGINGTVKLRDEGVGGNALASLVSDKLTLDRNLYREYFRTFKKSAPDGATDHIRIDSLEYGILKFENVDCALSADNEKIAIKKLSADIFGGRVFSSGDLSLGAAGDTYNFSFLFNDISLDAISKRLSPTEEYITGRVNGLVWLTGEGGQLDTIDGPFEFWSVSSQKEPRSIGKALLDKLGAKERLILGTSRSYDKGEISGYINKGLITFKKFNISNSVLGIKNLSIKADPVKNSISISHLVSVIREIARRSQSGGPMIETQ